MKIYLDKENAVSLARYKKTNSSEFYNCMSYLTDENAEVMINVSKEEFKNLADQEGILCFANEISYGKRKLIWGQTPKIQWKESTHDRIKTSKFRNIDDLQSIYLSSSPSINSLQKRGQLIIGGIGQEVTVISSGFVGKTNEDRLTQKPNLSKINSWDDAFCHFSTPMTDLIICDEWLTTPSNWKYFDKGLYSAIVYLVQKVKAPLNIVLFAKFELDTYDKAKLQNILNAIKDLVRKTTNDNVYVTWVLAPSKVLNEHSRSVISNYQYINTGNLLTYNFDKDGKSNINERAIYVHSLLSKKHQKDALSIIGKLQCVINRIYDENLNNNIIGDCVSNFLKF